MNPVIQNVPQAKRSAESVNMYQGHPNIIPKINPMNPIISAGT